MSMATHNQKMCSQLGRGFTDPLLGLADHNMGLCLYTISIADIESSLQYSLGGLLRLQFKKFEHLIAWNICCTINTHIYRRSQDNRNQGSSRRLSSPQPFIQIFEGESIGGRTLYLDIPEKKRNLTKNGCNCT
jgi:hypothetical protein